MAALFMTEYSVMKNGWLAVLLFQESNFLPAQNPGKERQAAQKNKSQSAIPMKQGPTRAVPENPQADDGTDCQGCQYLAEGQDNLGGA